jgi:hypothetical protein
MAIDFSEMDRCTKDFIERSRIVVGVDVASEIDYTVVYQTSDGARFTEFGTWPREREMRNVTPQKPKQIEEKQ